MTDVRRSMHGNEATSENERESAMVYDAYEVAQRLYGSSLEPTGRRELETSLERWRGLESADRTFVLAHLGMLQLRALDEVLGALEPAVADDAVEHVVDELGELEETDAVTEEIGVVGG